MEPAPLLSLQYWILEMCEHIRLTVRKMQYRDLDCVLRWRNHPKIRKFMIRQHEITDHEHIAWFDRASRDETRALIVIEDRNQPLGCVVFSGVRENSTTDWSFYSNPTGPHGIGKHLCSTALNFAFSELGVHKVFGRVLDFNHASIRIHQRLGFTQEGILRSHCRIDTIYRDLLCFGILASEWTVVNKAANA